MRTLPELDRVAGLLRRTDPLLRSEVLTTIEVQGHRFAQYGLCLGTPDPTAPTLGLFGGVHGLERVGTHVVLSLLEHLLARLEWDTGLRDQLAHARIVSIPLINPGGMFLNRRSNPAGVDLMRNAPVDAMVKTPRLVGGHRIGRFLPWYRGQKLEPENAALFAFVRREIFEARSAIVLDCHSGFGMKDRLWYPYAKSTSGYPRVHESRALARRLVEVLPYHPYQIEPQSTQYTTHGDIWDHLFDAHWAAHGPERLFLPWTLEMGSWSWVRKNPRQLFSAHGAFNPIVPHRYQRAMRRHLPLLHFLWSAVRHPEAWAEAP